MNSPLGLYFKLVSSQLKINVKKNFISIKNIPKNNV